MTKVVDPVTYYHDHAAEMRDYAAVAIARPIKAGETYHFRRNGTETPYTAEADGYMVQNVLDTGERSGFYTAQELADLTYDLSTAELPLPRRNLPPDICLTAVGMNESFAEGTPDDMREKYAPVDGYLLQNGHGTLFLSAYELTSVYNHSCARKQTHEELIVSFRAVDAIRGFVLKEDVSFLGMAEGSVFHAGDMMAITPAPVGFRYSGIRHAFAKVSLRVQPEAMQPVQPGTFKPPSL